MKKSNKILMATVAILLSLVLLSTSIISGIFAKFVVTSDASNEIKFNKFGVDLSLTLSDEFVEFLGGAEVVNGYTTTNGNSLSISVPSMKMAPGDVFTDAFEVSISGTPTVNCRFKLDIDLVIEQEKFIIPKGECGTTSDKLYFPIRFGMSYVNANGNDKYSNFFDSGFANSSVSSDDPHMTREEIMHAAMYEYYSAIYFSEGVCDDGKGGACNISEFTAGQPIHLHPVGSTYDKESEKYLFYPIDTVSYNTFYMGFEWLFDKNAVTNQMDTYIVENNPDGIGFSYTLTLSLEQT